MMPLIADCCRCERMTLGGDLCASWPPEGLNCGPTTLASLSKLSLSGTIPLHQQMSPSFGGTSTPSAPDFIDIGTSWLEQLLDDPARFPVRPNTPFPADFVPSVCKPSFYIIYCLMAHLFTAHYDRVIALGLEGHCNALFAHFCAFVRHFDLVAERWMRPLMDGLIVPLLDRHGVARGINASSPTPQVVPQNETQ